MTRQADHAACPDGIEPDHIVARHRWHDHASPASLLVLLAVVAFGLSGHAGSRPVERAADAPAARLAVRSPEIVRNGEIYEAVIAIDARQRIGRLVLGISPALLRETTVNSTMPAAADESYGDGLFRFDHGAVAGGTRFEVKLALQGNPSLYGENAGRIAVFDGATPLVELPLTLRIRP